MDWVVPNLEVWAIEDSVEMASLPEVLVELEDGAFRGTFVAPGRR